MAVYERTYRPYQGELTPQRWRFLVIPRYAYREIFHARWFVAFFVACFVWPLILAAGMYLSYNLTFLKTMMQQTGTTIEAGSLFGFKYEGSFFLYAFTVPQFWLSFFLVFLVGPQLISADLRNSAMPLYFCRPFTRTEYVLGKIAVMIILLSSITWVPGLLLFLLHSYLAGGSWMFDHLGLAVAIFLGSWISIALLTLISLALSAYVKWKPLARLALFGVFVVAAGLGVAINGILGTKWGSLVNLGQLLHSIWAGMFDVGTWTGIPAWSAWLAMLVFLGLCLLLLARKVKAYEVVR